MSLGQAAAAYDAYNRTAPYEGKVVLQDLYNEPYNSAPIGHYDARMLNVNYHPNHYVQKQKAVCVTNVVTPLFFAVYLAFLQNMILQ